jgi:glycine cleavage system H protein
VNPKQLFYAKSHEWVQVESADGARVATVGISAFAVEALTDLVFIELPDVGRHLDVEEPFGEVESVKAVSDLYSPVAGEVIEVNAPLAENLEWLSEDPYERGWMMRLRLDDAADTAHLMDHQAYEKQCAEEGE